VAFAIERSGFGEHNESSAIPLDVKKIGISAGEPVTDDTDDLLERRYNSPPVSVIRRRPAKSPCRSQVREPLCRKQFLFEDRGLVRLKGLPEPTTAYRVSWGDAG
jgi:hypothetical protein